MFDTAKTMASAVLKEKIEKVTPSFVSKGFGWASFLSSKVNELTKDHDEERR